MAVPREMVLWALMGFSLCLVVLVQPGLGTLTTNVDYPVEYPDLIEREKDFVEWVERVGSRTHVESSTHLNESKVLGLGLGRVLTLRVNRRGVPGQYKSVQAAVNAVPHNYNKRVVIRIAPGIYREKVEITNKPFIMLEGVAGADYTVLAWNDTADSVGSTFESASVAINSDNFIAKGITFQNFAPAPLGGSINKQAVALRVSGDKASFFNCKFLGSQDTLYDQQGRHYFENCYIEGSIDFICGDGQSLYSGCTLHAISSGSLTAQRRESLNQDTGFSFVNCKVTGSGMVYLGRAWGRYSRVVFSYTSMDAIIKPQGWDNWGDSTRQKSVLYGEYKCTGAGANQKGRVAWSHQLTAIQAAPFQSLSFVNGEEWVLQT